MFTSEELWCQMFSEPGAGSDVAGLSTRAERDGDEWTINGQKVWTSIAHLSSFGLLIARTDPNVPKHNGITAFLIDMKQPGVEVRPLRQMTGQAEFNEVYFTNAKVPDSHRISAVNDGWRTAITTLMNERVAIGGSVPVKGSGPIDSAVKAWRGKSDAEKAADGASKDQLMSLWIEAEVLRLTNIRAAALRRVGTPGPEGSVAKLHMAELNKRIYSFTMNLIGAEGMIFPVPYTLDRSKPREYSTPQEFFLRSRANSIEGGTSEVMRNILGERVLGLPGDVRTDKDVAWKDVLRN
jgi:alkylation response protein AidB-like acyl-CoA dehydrogenase